MKLLYTILFAFFISCSTEPEVVKDCAGVEGGSATIDDCEQCVGGITGNVANYLQDCSGECGGDATEDCLGECNGLAVTDECGTCDSDTLNDCANIRVKFVSNLFDSNPNLMTLKIRKNDETLIYAYNCSYNESDIEGQPCIDLGNGYISYTFEFNAIDNDILFYSFLVNFNDYSGMAYAELYIDDVRVSYVGVTSSTEDGIVAIVDTIIL